MHLFQHLSGLLLVLPIPISAARPLQDQAPLARPQPPKSLLQGHMPVMAPSTNDGTPKIQTQPSVSLTDVLGPNRALTIFSSLSRQHAAASSRLSDRASDPPLTVLAPLNSAFDALPRKPWEHPAGDDVESLSGPDGKDRADENLRRLVDAHVVAQSPWQKGDKVRTFGGRELWWEERDGKKIIMPDEVEVDRVASRVANGELWMIRGVLNYQ